MEVLMYVIAAPRILLKIFVVVAGVVLVLFGTREAFRRYRGEKEGKLNAAVLAFVVLSIAAVLGVQWAWHAIGNVVTGEIGK